MCNRSGVRNRPRGVVLAALFLILPLLLLVPFNAETAYAQAEGDKSQEEAEVESATDAENQGEVAGETGNRDFDKSDLEQYGIVLEDYNYDPAGRRDPFVSLIPPTEDVKARPRGIRGMAIADVSLKGIHKQGGIFTVWVHGSDGKGYFLQEGAQLWDGVILKVEATRVTFRRKTRDPLAEDEYVTVVMDLYPEEGVQ